MLDAHSRRTRPRVRFLPPSPSNSPLRRHARVGRAGSRTGPVSLIRQIAQAHAYVMLDADD